MASTELLFQTDSYATEFDAQVVGVRADGGIVLDRTLFYYTSGGQPHDTGKITRKSDGQTVDVKEVRKVDGEVVHIPVAPAPGSPSSPSFAVGDSIRGQIDWARRYRLMRMHTSGHILSALMFAKGILITGNQLGPDQSRFDFNMADFNRELIDGVIAEANQLCVQSHPIKVYFMPRDEALKLPGMVKLATALPPEITQLRIVEISGIDTQADGGTHVKDTMEIGKIEFVKADNKGAANRRVYFTVKP